jgi:hypothetical protein
MRQFVTLTPITGLVILERGSRHAPGDKMIEQRNSYRYYYYYGPLSGWRDGRAIDCREVIT